MKETPEIMMERYIIVPIVFKLAFKNDVTITNEFNQSNRVINAKNKGETPYNQVVSKRKENNND